MGKETVETLCQKAQKAVQQGNNEHARQFFLQALGLRSDLPNVHYGLATVCFLLNDLTSAAYHFKEVTRLEPSRAGAYINLGAVYNRLNMLDDAVKVLRRGIQLDHNRAEGYYNLGLVYRRLGQLDLAIQAYREATRINPRMADAHYNLANLYLEHGQFGLARSHYGSALELRPNWEKAKHGLEQVEAALSPQEATLSGNENAAEEMTMVDEVKAPQVDPEKIVDPVAHGGLLSNLHKATIESENQGRSFLSVLETEIEPALKVLSSCLLYPNATVGELDACVQKVETALTNMRNAQRSLQSSMEKVRVLGDKLLKS